MAAEPSNAIPSEPDTPAGSVEDEGILCPFCQYNLTGLLSGRCPECGSLIDKDRLREAQIIEFDALIPWDRPDVESWWQAFWSTAYITCGRPKRFAYAFSVQPQKTRAASYFYLCLLIAAAALAIPHAAGAYFSPFFSGRNVFFASFLVVMTYVAVGRWIATTLVAAMIVHGDGQHHYRLWRTIVRYSGGHMLLLVPVSVFFGLVPLLTGAVGYAAEIAVILLHLGCCGVLLLWGFTISPVLFCRAPNASKVQVTLALLCLGMLLLYVIVWVATAVVFEALGYSL
jgi:hypothetical protein